MTNWVNPWLACDLLSWARLVVPHWRELRARHVGVLLVVTAAAALNTVLGAVQFGLLMLPGIASRRVRGPLFIIGHWRSGTTVLHHLLSLDPQFTFPNNYVCFAPHHFLLTEWLLRDGFNWLAPFRRPMDALPLQAQDPQEDEFALLGLGALSPYTDMAFPGEGLRLADRLARDQADGAKLRRWRKKMTWFVRALTMRQPRRVVLKSPAHTLRVQTLLSMYPDAQFVSLTRSAEDTVASTIAMWKSMCAAYALGGTTETRWEEAAVEDFLAFQHALCGVRESLGPNQYFEIALEQLIKDPVDTLRHLYESFQLGEFHLTNPIAIRYLQAIRTHVQRSHTLSESARQQLESRIWAIRSSTHCQGKDLAPPPKNRRTVAPGP